VRCCRLDSKVILYQATGNAHIAVHDRYKGYGGTTLSAFILDNVGNFEAVNVGDSRIYLVIGKNLEQISTDDTIDGMLGKPDLSNYLLQHIGIEGELDPHMLNISKPKKVKKIVLTSDGAHFIDHKMLQSVLIQNEKPVTLAKRLVNISKWCGGSDNASALVFADTNLLTLPTDHIKTELGQVWNASDTIQLTKDGVC
jgi:serine/threonine protein phosphatase PrpC